MPLMPKPFAVLQYLVDHPGRLITHDQLLAAVWPDTYVQPEVLRRYILEIRRALGDQPNNPKFVQTFPKRGYQFIAPVVDEAPPPVGERDPAALATLVGRGAALADLNRRLRAALSGQRQIVFVIGEAGIGKTSLVDAFQHASAEIANVAMVRGQSVEGFGGKEPYYPLLEAIGQLARGSTSSSVVTTLATNAPTWLIQFPSLIRSDQQAALQREIVGATRERMVRELCEALEVITEQVPLVLILEDLHWVDHSTLDCISAIARRREPARLLVVGTFRPADVIVSESPLKALKQDLLLHRLAHEIELERLRESHVSDYLSAHFPPDELPCGLASVIHRHSDGNPLFMTAMLDHLEHRGVLTRADERWTLTAPIAQVDPGVPETLKQLLETQLQRLGEPTQQMLKCASVAGEHFTASSIATMLGLESSRVEELCESLAEQQQFLKSSGHHELPNGLSTPEYHFRHALYREVLYRRLNPALRATFHRRLAEGLEAWCSPAEPELAAQIAAHFEEGLQYEAAIKYSMLAAANARRRYVHTQAIAVLDHARGLLSRIETDRRRVLELQILERTGDAYYALGEMEHSARTYALMADCAADGNQLASQADALIRHSHAAESIPFFARAVEIDPNFAEAYVYLSRIYSNLGEADRAKEYATIAYERREHVGERDRLSFTYQYHYEVTGDQAQASETLEEWKRAFPREFQPVNSLAVIHNFLGRFERAVDEGREALRRNDRHGYPYSNLAHAYRGLGRFDDARATAERALALEIETLPTRRLLYQLAAIAGDQHAAESHLAWAKDKPREFDMVGARAQVMAWAGKVGQARQLYLDAARMAEVRDLHDVGTSHLAWATSMELAYGNLDEAGRMARLVLARSPSYDSRLRAALALALTGSTRDAEAIVNELVRGNPHHTLINAVLVPIVRAAVALGRAQPARALEHLDVVAPHELGFIAALLPVHLRGHAYLMLGSPERATGEFQRILDHRGSDPFSPFHAVAPLGLARARAAAGDTCGSLREYERLAAAWVDADRDLPVLREAREHVDGNRSI